MTTTLITEEEKIKLKEYAELKVEAREIKMKLKAAKPLVEQVLVRVHAEDTPVESDIGKLSLRPRRTWVYSDGLEGAMTKVKSQQKFEEATGKATFETQYDVYFK